MMPAAALHVLLADRIGDVACGKRMLGRLLRIDPHAHRIVARAEDLHLPDAFDAREAVLDVQRRIVAQIGDVIAVRRRNEIDHHDEVGRALDGGDAERAHFRRQAGLGLRHAVLHELLRLVRIRAELEGDGQRQDAVGRRLAVHVEHVLHAVDLLFQRRGDGFGNDDGVCAGIDGAHHDGWRNDLRIFGNRQGSHADQACHHDEDRQHPGKDRAIHEETRNIHVLNPSPGTNGPVRRARLRRQAWDFCGRRQGAACALPASVTSRRRRFPAPAGRRRRRGGCAAGR